MGVTALTTIEDAIQAARQSPGAWPEILAAVRDKQFVARALVSRDLAIQAATFGNPGNPEENDAWFLEGSILFAVLVAFEAAASSEGRFQELLMRGAREVGASEIATAAVQLGSSLAIAAKILGGPKPSAVYAAIGTRFADDLLQACEEEEKRQQAGRKWGRLGQWLRARFIPASQLDAYRIVWTHDELIQLRIAALQYRAELGSGAGGNPQTESASIEAELGRLDHPSQARCTKAVIRGDAGRKAFNEGRYADAVTALKEAVLLWEQGQDPAEQAALAEVLTVCGRAEVRAGDPWQALPDLNRGIELLEATGQGAGEFACDALFGRGLLFSTVEPVDPR